MTIANDIRTVGSAGLGIADQICDAITLESGKPKDNVAMEHIWCVDKHGLLLDVLGDELSASQSIYAKRKSEWKVGTALLDVVKAVKPHVLIGTSTKPKAFTKEVVQAMADEVDRPIIFPLSNPTKLHEAVPTDLYAWTNGKVLTATGSPFDAVQFDGQEHEVAECNNSVAFPGIGLGVVLSRARLVTTRLLVAATKALAACAPAFQDERGALLPDVTETRETSVHIAAAVIQTAVQDNLAQSSDIPPVHDVAKLKAWVKERMWEAQYQPLKRTA